MNEESAICEGKGEPLHDHVGELNKFGKSLSGTDYVL